MHSSEWSRSTRPWNRQSLILLLDHHRGPLDSRNPSARRTSTCVSTIISQQHSMGTSSTFNAATFCMSCTQATPISTFGYKLTVPWDHHDQHQPVVGLVFKDYIRAAYEQVP